MYIQYLHTYVHTSLTGFPGRIVAPRLILTPGTRAVPRPGGKGRRLRGLRDPGSLHGGVGRQGRRGGRRRDTFLGGLPAGAVASLAAGGAPPRPAGARVRADTAGLPEGLTGRRAQRHQEGQGAVGHAERVLREEFFRGLDVLVPRPRRLVSVFERRPGPAPAPAGARVCLAGLAGPVPRSIQYFQTANRLRPNL